MRTLQNALTASTLGHAYLFSGLRGVGKTTVARVLAKAVNCEQGPTPNPCCSCVSCQEVTDGSSLDVVELDGASNRGIDDVRELKELLRYRPTRDRYRVIIIDEVHMLTREAFNALLKSLEEPPPYIIFIFATTERHKVPATILSRCQQLDYRPVGPDLIAARLSEIAAKEEFAMSPGAAAMISRAAQGSVRDALSLVDQLRAFSGDEIDEDAVAAVLGVPRFEQVANLVRVLAVGSAAQGLALLRQELVAGHDQTVLFHEVGRLLRTLLHLLLDPELEPTLSDEQRAELIEIAAPIGPAALTRMLGLWLDQELLVLNANNRELALEVACLRLARWPAVQRIEAALAGEETVALPTPPTPTISKPPAPQSKAARPAPAPPAPAAASAPPAPQAAQAAPAPPAPAAASAPQAAPAPAAAPAPPAPAEDDPSASPLKRLSTALWDDRPRIAAALESAELLIEGPTLTLSFGTGNKAKAMATFLDSGEARPILEATCRQVFPGVDTVQIRVEGSAAAAKSAPGLEKDARNDPEVVLARRILGGDIVSVLPDREDQT